MTGDVLTLDLLGTRFEIAAPEPRWRAFLDELWSELALSARAPAAEAVVPIRVDDRDEAAWLELPDTPPLRFDDPWALADALRYWLVERAVERAREVVPLHAATVVAPNGAGVLLAGGSGAGKTTLALALVAHGWSLGSDDLAPVDVVTGMIRPFPKPMSVRGGPAALPPRRRWPDYGTGPALVPVGALPHQNAPFPAAALLFIRYDPDADPALEPMGSGEALAACVEYVRSTDRVTIATLGRLLRRARAARLKYPSSDSAVGLIRDSGPERQPETG